MLNEHLIQHLVVPLALGLLHREWDAHDPCRPAHVVMVPALMEDAEAHQAHTELKKFLSDTQEAGRKSFEAFQEMARESIRAYRRANQRHNQTALKSLLDGEFPLTDKTLRQLQTNLPWTGHYHRDFRSSAMTHKDFGHASLHVSKTNGKLASIINDAEHGGVAWETAAVREEVEKYLADLVICALRMANTCPEGVIDLQTAVEHRITAKNNQLAVDAEILAATERAPGKSVFEQAKEEARKVIRAARERHPGVITNIETVRDPDPSSWPLYPGPACPPEPHLMDDEGGAADGLDPSMENSIFDDIPFVANGPSLRMNRDYVQPSATNTEPRQQPIKRPEQSNLDYVGEIMDQMLAASFVGRWVFSIRQSKNLAQNMKKKARAAAAIGLWLRSLDLFQRYKLVWVTGYEDIPNNFENFKKTYLQRPW